MAFTVINSIPGNTAGSSARYVSNELPFGSEEFNNGANPTPWGLAFTAGDGGDGGDQQSKYAYDLSTGGAGGQAYVPLPLEGLAAGTWAISCQIETLTGTPTRDVIWTDITPDAGNATIVVTSTGHWCCIFTVNSDVATPTLRLGLGCDASEPNACSIRVSNAKLQQVSTLSTAPDYWIPPGTVPFKLSNGNTVSSGGGLVTQSNGSAVSVEANSFLVGSGDSWSNGWDESNNRLKEWPDRFKSHLSTGTCLAINPRPGMTMDAMIAQQSSLEALAGLNAASIATPTGTVLQGGINDITQNISGGDTVQECVDEMLADVALWISGSIYSRHYICNVPPTGRALGSDGELARLQYNPELAATYASNPNVTIIDISTATEDPANTNQLRPDYDSGDGIHPNALGSKIVGNLIVNTIEGNSMAIIYAGVPPLTAQTNSNIDIQQTGRCNSIATAEGLTAVVPANYQLTEIGAWVKSSDNLERTATIAVYPEGGTVEGQPDGALEASANITYDFGSGVTAQIAQAFSQPVAPGDYTVAAMALTGNSNWDILDLSDGGAEFAGANCKREGSLAGVLPDPFTGTVTIGNTALFMWAKFEEIDGVEPTLTLPFPIGNDGGPMFSATSSDTIATVEAADFLNGIPGWASLLTTDDVVIIECSDGTKMYTVTVDRQARIITLSTGLLIV